MKSEQEVFNEVYAHLIHQGERAIAVENNRCKYRTEDGLKCAAGILIKDEHYNKELEGQSATSDSVREALENSGVGTVCLYLVSKLQSVHDIISPKKWRNALDEVAKEYDLTVPIID